LTNNLQLCSEFVKFPIPILITIQLCTNRTKTPDINQLEKSELLGYDLNANDMPLTNPADITNELDKQFIKSKNYSIES